MFNFKRLLLALFIMTVIVELNFLNATINYFKKVNRNYLASDWKSQPEVTTDPVSWTNDSGLVSSRRKKLVLLYTTLFGRVPWPDLKNSFDFTHFRGESCKVQNCEITYNKSRLAQSDAIVFHGRDLPTPAKLERIPRNERQRWVFFTHENPIFSYYNFTGCNYLFNWTMSYRRDSDFFVPYNYYRRLRHEEVSKLDEPKNYAKGKDKFIAWMAGNCGQLRDHVVQRLLLYVNVTVFGACAKKFNQTANHCSRGSRDCKQLLRRFKFYLAFENAICTDYISEKYWYVPFDHDIVPVVLGGSNYDAAVAIPGSFINVLDFPSIKHLANYLEYLNSNDTAYNEYFRWKSQFKVAYILSVVWTCNLCAALNNETAPAKVYKNLDVYWGIESSCARHEARISKLLESP